MEPGYGTEFRPDEQSPEQADLEQTLSKGDGPYNPGFHIDNLHDQNEGAGGELLDLRTGLPIDNSRETDADLIRKRGGHVTDGPMPPLPEEDDEASRWLAEHDKAA